MGGDLSIWLSWVLGMLVALGLIALIWWSLFADRSRGRKRCPHCWHEMTGAPSLRCPECGHEVHSEYRLFATRRRWGLALFFLVCLVVGTLAFRFRVTQEGITSFAPTGVLLWLLPHSSTGAGPPDDIQAEIQARLLGASVDASFIEELATRINAGDSAALPCSPEWESRYGRLAMTLHQRAQTALSADDPALVAAERFRELPIRADIHAARSTGEDGHLLVDLGLREWWPAATEAEIWIRDTSDERTLAFQLDAGTQARPVSLLFAPARDGETSRQFEISERHRATKPDGSPLEGAEWTKVSSKVVEVALTPLPAVPALRGVASSTMDAAIDDAFSEGVLRWESGRHPVAFRIDATRTGSEEFAGVLVGLEVCLREHGQVRRRLEAWWPAGPQGGGLRFSVVEEDLEALERFRKESAGGSPDGWTLTLRGDPAIAARAYVPSTLPDAVARPAFAKYWTGERTLPAPVTPMAGEAPRRRWRRLVTTPSPPRPDDAGARPAAAAPSR